ncbi:LysR substrate-binding domain-containing protein [Secundilactobacillus hailunensis]|uniref:LysR substrate-binding domain-containing protein n=1 Tax=Secundilactobacillus hailunensis TaxID=2559923 RepID=A0ABW1TC32_9LACO|nr:LysR family transcriptional regulator [Secundilactobacillus hailunensis]
MKLTTLKYFVEVATELSFTKASEKLYISQPTLSRHIRELETELGVTLFERHSHSLGLTSAGQKFLVEATTVLKQVDHLSHLFDAQTDDTSPATVLNIGYLANFKLSEMYQLLNQFKAAHQNVQFTLNQETPMHLTDGLNDGSYDMVFSLASYLQNNAAIAQTLFMENHLQIALPRHHRLSQKKRLHFADLKQENFILLERQQSPLIVDYVISQGLKNGFNLKANYYVNSLEEGLSMVAVGKGLAFLYSGMNDHTLEEKYQIKIADLEDNSLDQNIVVAIDQNNQNQFLQQLYGIMKNHLASNMRKN